MLSLWRAQSHGMTMPSGRRPVRAVRQPVRDRRAWPPGTPAAWCWAIATAAAVCVAVVYIRVGFETIPPPNAWVVGGVPGIIVGLPVPIWSRRLTVILSALAGAAVAVGSAALVLTEGQEGLKNWLGGPKLDVVPLAVLAGAVIALAAGGMRLQFRLPPLASKWLKPTEKDKAEKPAAKPAAAAS